MPRPSPTALAMARYALSKTDSLSLSRTARDRPAIGRALTGWAAASLSACCSRRSILKSSSRMDSSLSHGAACDPRPKARRITDFIFRPGRYLLAAVLPRDYASPLHPGLNAAASDPGPDSGKYRSLAPVILALPDLI